MFALCVYTLSVARRLLYVSICQFTASGFLLIYIGLAAHAARKQLCGAVHKLL